MIHSFNYDSLNTYYVPDTENWSVLSRQSPCSHVAYVPMYLGEEEGTWRNIIKKNIYYARQWYVPQTKISMFT